MVATIIRESLKVVEPVTIDSFTTFFDKEKDSLILTEYHIFRITIFIFIETSGT
jgi:hypothetical protein